VGEQSESLPECQVLQREIGMGPERCTRGAQESEHEGHSAQASLDANRSSSATIEFWQRTMWFFAGVALVLESPAMALAAVPVFALAFLPRMLVEEGVLRRDLKGYTEYVSRVRFRILPGLV